MTGGVPEPVAPANSAGVVPQPWPSRGAAYYALTIVILATLLNFFDAQVFGMMAQRIKLDFNLDDEKLGFLIGPANVIFYVLIGIPLARLVDIYPRKIVLACGMATISCITVLGGLAQNFKQLFSSRMLVGAGGSAHAPGAYSILADFFPPLKLPRAIGFLQLGFIGGNALGYFLGGTLISLAATWPISHWMGLTMHGWQWILMMVGAPGLLIAVLLLFIREPARRGIVTPGKALPVSAALHEIYTRRAIYLPLFIGLACSAAEFLGMQGWRAPFLIRTFGWDIAKIGQWLGAGVPGFLADRCGARHAVRRAAVEALQGCQRARHRDPVRAHGALRDCGADDAQRRAFGGCAASWSASSASPRPCRRMPRSSASRPTRCAARSRRSTCSCSSCSVQLARQLAGTVTKRVFHSDADLWKSMVLIASILMPLAAIAISRGIKPYGREEERLAALEAAGGGT